MGLAIEFVGIANQLFFDGLGQEILMGQRQLLFNDILYGESGPGVPLANAGMTGIAFPTQYLSTDAPVKQIGLRAKTMNARRMAAEDTYIVEHGSFFHKPAVNGQLRPGITNAHSTLLDERAVGHEDVTQCVIIGIVFINDTLIIHNQSVDSPTRRRVKEVRDAALGLGALDIGYHIALANLRTLLGIDFHQFAAQGCRNSLKFAP